MLTLAAAGVALGHTPTAGGSRGSFTSNQLVTYRFNASYPSWVTTAFTAEYETYYDDAETNNSLSPRLDYSSSGSARAFYHNSTTSPCTGSMEWLGCAPTQYQGNSTFRVYVRNLESAPHDDDDWGWYENGNSCSGDSVCFYMKRTILHELGHAVLKLGHDGQGESYTVMGDAQPTSPNTNWSRREWVKCDQARAQMLWSTRDHAGPIAGCFDHLASSGSNGLQTVVSLSASPTTVCVGDPVNVSGLLRTADYGSYDRMGGVPLGQRTVTIKRDGSTVAQPLTSSTSGTYSVSVSAGNPGSRAFVASFPNEGSEALTGDSSPTVTITVLTTGACNP